MNRLLWVLVLVMSCVAALHMAATPFKALTRAPDSGFERGRAEAAAANLLREKLDAARFFPPLTTEERSELVASVSAELRLAIRSGQEVTPELVQGALTSYWMRRPR